MGDDVLFTSVSTDTRQIQPGALFVALSGPNFDGNRFVDQAAAKGAVGALVREGIDATALPVVAVDDTRVALGSLAAYWRNKHDATIYGVTGSNGKTTVKEMLAAILSVGHAGIATKGNLNNDIGMPLTLLRLRADDDYAVLEMGMNHPGEIAYLTQIARPDVAVINNAAGAHLEGLGSIENVALAKGEILQGLRENGVAVLNADDEFFGLWAGLAKDKGCRVVRFGLDSAADVSAEIDAGWLESTLQLRTPEGEIDIALPLPGRHNVMNALAASAAALAGDATLEQVKSGLENMHSVSGRLVARKGIAGVTVLDDTYNANPASLAAGLDVLSRFPGRKVLALGDMGELGEDSLAQHAEAGKQALASGVDELYATGEQSAAAVDAFGENGRWFADKDALTAALKGQLTENTAVLVKGSRASRMEQVSQALCGSAQKGE